MHTEHVALDRALREARDAGVDAILQVGDVLDGDGDADRCCELLALHGALGVRGNHERWFLAGQMRSLPDVTRELRPGARAFVEALPVTRELATLAGPLMLGHGIGEDDMAVVTPDTQGYALQCVGALRELRERTELRLFVCGHTHRRMVRAFGDLVIVNAGTLHRLHDGCFAIVDLERAEVRFTAVDVAGRLGETETVALPLAP